MRRISPRVRPERIARRARGSAPWRRVDNQQDRRHTRSLCLRRLTQCTENCKSNCDKGRAQYADGLSRWYGDARPGHDEPLLISDSPQVIEERANSTK